MLLPSTPILTRAYAATSNLARLDLTAHEEQVRYQPKRPLSAYAPDRPRAYWRAWSAKRGSRGLGPTLPGMPICYVLDRACPVLVPIPLRSIGRVQYWLGYLSTPYAVLTWCTAARSRCSRALGCGGLCSYMNLRPSAAF
eukprot:2487728-Rhodomonas_salina.1